MYHKASISPLSGTQISKILNGHSVRVSPGNKHDIELSKEQFKKFSKAHKNGKAMTLTMDPYQIQNHQHLRGSGNVKKNARGNAKRLITAATDRAIRSISGGNVMQHQKTVENVLLLQVLTEQFNQLKVLVLEEILQQHQKTVANASLLQVLTEQFNQLKVLV